MILRQWQPHHSGKLRGFLRIEFDTGLVLPDIKVFVGERGPFVTLPEKPVLREGQVQRDGTNRPVYAPVAEWRDRETSTRFSAAVIRLLLKAYPDALEGGEASTTGRATTGQAVDRPRPSGSRLAHNLQRRLRQ